MDWNPAATLSAQQAREAAERINRDSSLRDRMARIREHAERIGSEPGAAPASPSTRGRPRAVIRIEDGKPFRSLSAAARAVGVKEPQNIWRAVTFPGRKARRACGGYTWRYAEPGEVPQEPTPDDPAVACNETGEIFPTTSAAARWSNQTKGEIWHACARTPAGRAYPPMERK